MVHQTARSFLYPDSLVRAFDHWLVLARPKQVTLGSLVLVSRSDAIGWPDLPTDSFAELKTAVTYIDRLVNRFVKAEKINYLMLMMVDPQVHFHVVPRYAGNRSWNGMDFPDAGWPGPPALTSAVSLDSQALAVLVARLEHDEHH
jgi:diadenosine tetraphosphate (Ap4A) HIT family hydrolase